MKLNTLCKALGNAERIRLVACLSKEETVSNLLLKCNLSQSALSQHLAVLKKAGLVTTRRSGKNIFYKTVAKDYVKLANLLINHTK